MSEHFNNKGNIEIIVDKAFDETNEQIGPLQGVITCMKLITSKYIAVSPVDSPFISTKHYLELIELLDTSGTGISSFINEEGKITSINFVMSNYPEKIDEIIELVCYKISRNIRVRMSDLYLSTSISLIKYNSKLHGSFVNINKEPEMVKASKFVIDEFKFDNNFQIHHTTSYLNFLKQVVVASSDELNLEFLHQIEGTMLAKQVKNDVNVLLH